MYKTALTTGLLLVAWVLPAAAIDVTTGNTATFPNFIASTVTTAGTYYGSVASTSTSTVSVTGVTQTPTSKTWKLYARLTSSVTGMTVQVRRNSGGSGCAVAGGDSYTKPRHKIAFQSPRKRG